MNDAIKLYNKVLDTKRRNEDGIKPLMPLLNKIRSITTLDELNRNLYSNIRLMVPYYRKENVYNRITGFRHKVAVKKVFLDMMSKVLTDKDIEDILKAGGYLEE